MNTDTHVLLRMFQNLSYYFWVLTWMNVNNFQVVRVQPGVSYKSVAYTKKRVQLLKCTFSKGLTHNQTNLKEPYNQGIKVQVTTKDIKGRWIY